MIKIVLDAAAFAGAERSPARGRRAGARRRAVEFLHAPVRARTSRPRAGAKLFTEEIDKATGGELKVRLHLSGTLQISASNITQAVGENVVQIGDDLFNSGNIPVAGIPRLPMLIQSYEDFAKADAVLKPYIEKSFGQKGSTVLVVLHVSAAVHVGTQEARRRSTTSRA